MADIVIRQGHDLRIVGKPEQAIVDAPFSRLAGVRPTSIRGLKPRVLVEEGDSVRTGTPIIADKKNPDIVLTAPATGKVVEIRRGPRRVLLHVAIEAQPQDEYEEFGSLEPAAASREQVTDLLLRSGLWPTIIQHPFEKIADPQATPKAIFISTVETEPFLPDPNFILANDDGSFQVGLDALAKLTDGVVHLTHAVGNVCPAIANARNVQKHTVTGPHPAGQPMIHAFHIDRVKPGEVVWYVHPQNVQTIGRLFREGKLLPERVVTLAGNGIQESHRKYYRFRMGSSILSLVDGKLSSENQRIISGGVLTGEKVARDDFLGFNDFGVNVIPEGNKRKLLGWLTPGSDRYSVSRAFSSALSPADHKFEPDTNLNGGVRACIQSGYCLDVCPTDVQPLFVWKAVSYGDLEEAESLGILDCVECGLCTFVCPSKIEIGTIIRRGLDQIEKEG